MDLVDFQEFTSELWRLTMYELLLFLTERGTEQRSLQPAGKHARWHTSGAHGRRGDPGRLRPSLR